jgi:hypothetical protein
LDPGEVEDLRIVQPESAAVVLISNGIRFGRHEPAGAVAFQEEVRHAKAHFAIAVGRELVVVSKEGFANLPASGFQGEKGTPQQSQNNAAACSNDQPKQSSSAHDLSLTNRITCGESRRLSMAHDGIEPAGSSCC